MLLKRPRRVRRVRSKEAWPNRFRVGANPRSLCSTRVEDGPVVGNVDTDVPKHNAVLIRSGNRLVGGPYLESEELLRKTEKRKLAERQFHLPIALPRADCYRARAVASSTLLPT